MKSAFLDHKLLFLLAGCLLSLPLLSVASQEMASQQVKTAAEHADFASKSTKVQKVHVHLHHVINCLVGPGGKGFDKHAANPCKGQGNGALNEKNLSMKEKTSIEQALALARVGVKINNETAARDTARAVHELLSSSGM